MEQMKTLLKSGPFKSILAFSLLGIVLYFLRDMINLFLLIFIFSYLMYTLQNYIFIKINKLIKVKRVLVIAFIYVGILGIAVLLLSRYIPLAIKQLITIGIEISKFDIKSYKETLNPAILDIIEMADIQGYMKATQASLISTLTGFGKLGFNIFAAFILSIFLVLEKEELTKFIKKLLDSKIGFIFDTYIYFGRNFANSFGKVFEAQITISFINSVLSIISLTIMGFSQTLGLGFMIFILGMIPVAGVIISLIPLTIMAFIIGGIPKVIAVLVMIAVLHCIESYVLNPKLMAKSLKLPEFMTLLILLISEHLMGVWGLLLGLPLFMFILDILNIKQTQGNLIKQKEQE